jgi:hypothetical protein
LGESVVVLVGGAFLGANRVYTLRRQREQETWCTNKFTFGEEAAVAIHQVLAQIPTIPKLVVSLD